MSRDDDRDLQRFLDGKDPISSALRERSELAPPPALDAAILAEARAEAERPVRPKWLVPLSVAATVVLGTGLTLRLQDSVPMTQSVPEAAIAAQNTNIGEYDVAQPSLVPSAPAPRPSIEDIPRLEFDDDIAPRIPDVATDRLTRDAGRQVLSDGGFMQELPALPAPATKPAADSLDDASARARARASSERRAPLRQTQDQTAAEPVPEPAAASAPLSASSLSKVAAVKGPIASGRPAAAQTSNAASDLSVDEEADVAADVQLTSPLIGVNAGEPLPALEPGVRQALIDARVALASREQMERAMSPSGNAVFSAQSAPASSQGALAREIPDDPVDQTLLLVRTLVALDRVDEAQARLDRLAARLPDLALPDDFPLAPTRAADAPPSENP